MVCLDLGGGDSQANQSPSGIAASCVLQDLVDKVWSLPSNRWWNCTQRQIKTHSDMLEINISSSNVFDRALCDNLNPNSFYSKNIYIPCLIVTRRLLSFSPSVSWMSRSRVSVMLVGRGEESSTRATISSLMALITNSSRSTGRQIAKNSLLLQSADKARMKMDAEVGDLGIKAET